MRRFLRGSSSRDPKEDENEKKNPSIRSLESRKFDRVSGQATCSYAPLEFMRTFITWWRTHALPHLLKISVHNTSSSLIFSCKALISIEGRVLLWLSSKFMISPSACHSRIFAMFANYLTLGIFMNLVHGTWKLSSVQLL